jgi:hypothetical protein
LFLEKGKKCKFFDRFARNIGATMGIQPEEFNESVTVSTSDLRKCGCIQRARTRYYVKRDEFRSRYQRWPKEREYIVGVTRQNTVSSIIKARSVMEREICLK